MLTINSNIASLTAQNNLAVSQNAVQNSLQRLSSGLRINSAKDDAAGLYTAELMSSAIRGTNQAVRNATDGTSLAQTAEGALGQIANNLQRIREIAVQSANGTVQDRSGLQAETNQLTQEISRIVQTSKFNGVSLLSAATTLTFQVGSDGTSSNQVQVATTDLTATTGSAPALYAAASSIVTAVSGPAINTDQATYHAAVDFVSQATTAGVTGVSTGSGPGNPIIGYTTGTNATLDAAYATMQALATYWNNTGGDPPAGTSTQAGAIAAAQAVANSYNTPLTPTLNSYNSSLSGTGTIDVSTQGNASTALSKLDADIAKIATVRSTFGAVQNRFDAVVANLQNYSANITASRSRIVDADFASETANLTRGQVLLQAGTAVLAQANAMPQSVLALLR